MNVQILLFQRQGQEKLVPYFKFNYKINSQEFKIVPKKQAEDQIWPLKAG